MVGHQSSPDMYDLCDAMGMMIWQEMPLQWGYSNTEPIRKDILKVVEETVVQCRPHAAVVGWSAWNEGGQLEFSDKITALIKSLDSTRPMTKACGAGDFDTHIYPNLDPNLHRRTPLWSGVEVEFVSETGAYGFASLEQMKEIIGEDLFPFDSADYFWDVFNSYRYEDGPVFLDAPRQADWPTEKIRAYALSKIEASERWFAQYMKFQYENFRGMRFAPTNALIHCRFDDTFPSGFYGSVVTFTGRPRKAYFAAKEACQQVLPILFLDYTGAEDIRVVNEYWTRAWQGLTLKYDLQTREGKTVLHHEKKFDLPPDSTIKVMTRDEAGDIWHVPGGFLAALSVIAPDGTLLAENHYDLTQEEVEAFITSVYPPPPVEPVDSIVLKTSAITSPGSTKRVGVEGTYSKTLMELDGKSRGSTVRFSAGVSKPGDYLVRVACNSGEAIRSFQFLVDGRRADLESYPYLNANLPLTRRSYSSYNLAWYPGWRVRLSQGGHKFVLELPHAQAGPSLILDAVCLQYLRS
jgi:hypothetical protein